MISINPAPPAPSASISEGGNPLVLTFDVTAKLVFDWLVMAFEDDSFINFEDGSLMAVEG